MIADDAENSAALLQLLDEDEGGSEADARTRAQQLQQQQQPVSSDDDSAPPQTGERPPETSAPPPAPVQLDATTASIDSNADEDSKEPGSNARDDGGEHGSNTEDGSDEPVSAEQAEAATHPLPQSPPQAHEQTRDDASEAWTSPRRSGRRRAPKALPPATDAAHDAPADQTAKSGSGLSDSAASVADSKSTSDALDRGQETVAPAMNASPVDANDAAPHATDAAQEAATEHRNVDAPVDDDSTSSQSHLSVDGATGQQHNEDVLPSPSPRHSDLSSDAPADPATRSDLPDEATPALAANKPTAETASASPANDPPVDGSDEPQRVATSATDRTLTANASAPEIATHGDKNEPSKASVTSQHSDSMPEINEHSSGHVDVAVAEPTAKTLPRATRAERAELNDRSDTTHDKQQQQQQQTQTQHHTQQLLSSVQASSAASDDSEWFACATDAGDPYYYNARTHESRWTPPTPTHRNGSSASADATPLDANDASDALLFAAVSSAEPFDATHLERLLHADTHLEVINSAGLTPLQVACQVGNAHAASLLLYYGARPDASGQARDPQAPLLLACWSNHVELIQLLLDYGAPLTVTDAACNSVLHVVCTASRSVDALLLLLDRIARSDTATTTNVVNARNDDGETPLHAAVKAGFADAVSALLAYGAATDAEDAQGRTPLVLGILESQVECVQRLQAHLSTPSQSTVSTDRSVPLQPHLDAIDAVASNAAPDVATNRLDSSDPALVQLQARIAQLAPNEAAPTLRRVIDDVVQTAERRISELTGEIEAVKTATNDLETRNGQLAAENAQLVAEIAVERDERMRTQSQLETQTLELHTLRASHHATTTRCEMLDGIARGAHEKLRRERIEHSQYLEVVESHVRDGLDENERLVAALNELEAEWTERLAHQQQQQQQYAAYGATTKQSTEQHAAYDSEYDAVATADADTDDAVAPLHHDQNAEYYSADVPRTLTPTDESSAFYYSHDDAHGDADAYGDEEHGDEYAYDYDGNNDRNDAEEDDDNGDDERTGGGGTVTPQMSPARVGAVWNRFFENVAVTTAPHDDTQSQQQQKQDATRMHKSRSSLPTGQLATASSVFMAVRTSDLPRLQLLLLSGVSPNVRDIGEKGTPLHLACELGDVDALQLLCEFAADVETRDEAANTPLLVACAHGHLACVTFLLQSAADLAVVNANGDSALHLAAWDGSAECIAMLAEYDVDPLARNRYGLSPLANLRARSPLRHQFDALVADHPMRRTLQLLETLEQQVVDEISGGRHSSAIHDAANDSDEDGSDQQQQQQQHADASDSHVTADAAKRVSVGGNQTPDARGTTGSSATRLTMSWKDWLLGFVSAEVAQPQQHLQQPAVDALAVASQAQDAQPRTHRINSNESDGERGSSDFDGVDDNGALLVARRHEPLKPPPEIAAELQRAKLQLERPAVFATEAAAPQNFVAADRARLAAKSATSPTASAAQNVRARYVDTFNPA